MTLHHARNYYLQPTLGLGGLAVLVLGGILLHANLATANLTSTKGAPDQRRGAGSRGETCIVSQANAPDALWALTPRSNISLTTTAYPTFYWSTPPTRSGAELEFQLLESARPGRLALPIYTAKFPAPPTGGIVGLSLPKNLGLAGLAAGKSYRWSVALNCDSLNPERNMVFTFSSVVQRIATSPTLTQQLERAKTPEERAKVYASSGVWLESLKDLAPSQCSPSGVKSREGWSSLLKSVGLEQVSGQPLLEQCGDR